MPLVHELHYTKKKKEKSQQQTVAIEMFKQLMLVYKRHLSIVSSSVPS